MELDYSGLLNLGQAQAGAQARKDFRQAEGSQNTQNGPQGVPGASESKQAENLPKHYVKIDRQREAIAQICRQQQENIRAAGDLRVKITKGIQAGEDPYKLLLMALDCVSRMTGDRAFYEQNKAQLHQADKK